jgi:hypothetical protein
MFLLRQEDWKSSVLSHNNGKYFKLEELGRKKDEQKEEKNLKRKKEKA